MGKGGGGSREEGREGEWERGREGGGETERGERGREGGGETERGKMGRKKNWRGYTSLVATNSGNYYKVGNLKQTAVHELQKHPGCVPDTEHTPTSVGINITFCGACTKWFPKCAEVVACTCTHFYAGSTWIPLMH